MKIVVNKQEFGGFVLSQKAIRLYARYKIRRDDPILVRVVKELGNSANGIGADLKIIEIQILSNGILRILMVWNEL